MIVISLAIATREGPTPAVEEAVVVEPGDSEEFTDDKEESEPKALNYI